MEECKKIDKEISREKNRLEALGKERNKKLEMLLFSFGFELGKLEANKALKEVV